MHPRSHEVRPVALVSKIQEDDCSSGHVLAQEVLGSAAYDQNRPFALELLHMQGGSVAAAVPHIYRAPSHGKAKDIPCSSLHHDLSVIHGVSHPVLGIAVHNHPVAEEKGSQVVSRSAEDINLDSMLLWRVQSGADIALAAYISDDHLPLAGEHQIPQSVIQLSGLEILGIDLDRSHTVTSCQALADWYDANPSIFDHSPAPFIPRTSSSHSYSPTPRR